MFERPHYWELTCAKAAAAAEETLFAGGVREDSRVFHSLFLLVCCDHNCLVLNCSLASASITSQLTWLGRSDWHVSLAQSGAPRKMGPGFIRVRDRNVAAKKRFAMCVCERVMRSTLIATSQGILNSSTG